MKPLIFLRLSVLAFILSSCSHWNWVFKNESQVREQICSPDTVTATIIQERLVPLLQIDTALLRTLNEYESIITELNDTIGNMLSGSDSLQTSNHKLQTTQANLLATVRYLKQLASNTKVVERIKREPYAVYVDKQSTLQQLTKSEIKNDKLEIWIWLLSFIAALLLGIIVIILKFK